jgi:hypothetical protein
LSYGPKKLSALSYQLSATQGTFRCRMPKLNFVDPAINSQISACLADRRKPKADSSRMGPRGFGPRTSSLSATRSNQLSYEPADCAGQSFAVSSSPANSETPGTSLASPCGLARIGCPSVISREKNRRQKNRQLAADGPSSPPDDTDCGQLGHPSDTPVASMMSCQRALSLSQTGPSLYHCPQRTAIGCFLCVSVHRLTGLSTARATE